MTTVLWFCVTVCCTTELTQPAQPTRGQATLLGRADERLLVIRLGMWPNLRVGPMNFEQVRPGMTNVDVQKILGAPTKVVSGMETVMVSTPRGCRGVEVVKHSDWAGVDQVIVVYCGKKQTVELSYLRPLEEWARVDCLMDTRNDFEKLRDWLKPPPHE